MSEFAKIFNSDVFGQVLVVADQDGEGKPSIEFSFMPKGLGVCSAQFHYNQDDEGLNKRDERFKEIKMKDCHDFCHAMCNELGLES